MVSHHDSHREPSRAKRLTASCRAVIPRSTSGGKMLQFILAVALCAQIPEPPTDRQVLASLPETDAVRTNISITKTPVWTATGEPLWTCAAFYTETRGGVQMRRVHVVDLERK